jgi:hypothetical protein
MVRTRYVLEVSWAGNKKTYKKGYDYGRMSDYREKIERKKGVRDTSMSREFV